MEPLLCALGKRECLLVWMGSVQDGINSLRPPCLERTPAARSETQAKGSCFSLVLELLHEQTSA